eukprot:scaffold35662_cov56-Isochrysis_galbana.AAC.1
MAWLALGAMLALSLWRLRSWRPAVLFSVASALNLMLSGDNLLVFLLLIKQARARGRMCGE